MQNEGTKTLHIFLIEDNPGDVHLIMDALKQSGRAYAFSVANDGVEALAMLRRQGPHAQHPRPDFILLDLNLPRRNGREVLADLKADPNLRQIPVVVFSSSEAARDIWDSYALHANCYVTKPVELREFVGAVKAIEEFWGQTARLPRAHVA